MKTIKFIIEAIKLSKTIGTPANIEVGTFKVVSIGSLHHSMGRTGTCDSHKIFFELEFNPTHIQRLLDIGVKIDFNSVKMANISEKSLRFKSGKEAIKQGRYAPYYYMGNPKNTQTGVVENTLHANASCTVDILASIKDYCRCNHLHHVSIDNYFELAKYGWVPVERIIAPSKADVNITAFGKMIRKNVTDKRKNTFTGGLLPIEKRAMNKTTYSY